MKVEKIDRVNEILSEMECLWGELGELLDDEDSNYRYELNDLYITIQQISNRIYIEEEDGDTEDEEREIPLMTKIYDLFFNLSDDEELTIEQIKEKTGGDIRKIEACLDDLFREGEIFSPRIGAFKKI